MINAIKKNGGIVADVVKSLRKDYGIDITRDAIYKRKETNPAIAAAFTEAEETVLDIAESYLIKAINKGEMKPIMFYLRTKGKQRGYAERREITGAEGKPVEVDPLAKLSREELLQLAGLAGTSRQLSHVCRIPAEK